MIAHGLNGDPPPLPGCSTNVPVPRDDDVCVKGKKKDVVI